MAKLPKTSTPDCTTLRWQSGQMELVELIYALHEAGCFGKTPLKTVFAVVCHAFGCPIENYYRLFWDIKNRAADDRAYFLNKIKQSLSDKLFRMDGSANS